VSPLFIGLLSMFIGLLKEALGWFVSVAEAGLAITLVLAIGLFLGMTGFWMLGKLLGKLGGSTAADPFDDDPEEATGVPSSWGSIPRDDEWDDR
jgi:hypothetical protein